jgi:hypothetical protein
MAGEALLKIRIAVSITCSHTFVLLQLAELPRSEICVGGRFVRVWQEGQLGPEPKASDWVWQHELQQPW